MEKINRLKFDSMIEFKNYRIKDIGKLVGGTGFPEKYQGETIGQIPFYKVSDMNHPENKSYMTKSNNYISEEVLKKLKAKTLPIGTIVFAKVGAALLKDRKRILTRDSVIDNNMMGLILESKLANRSYVYQWLLNYKLARMSNVGALPSLNASDIYSVNIKLPPLEEQQKIGGFLSSLDKLIDNQEDKIERLKDLKKGYLQQLFSQKLRFKDDKGNDYPEWKKMRTEEIFIGISDKEHNGDLKVLSATQDRGVVPRESIGIDIKYNKESLKNYKRVSEGDFVISLRSFQGGFEYCYYEGIVSPAYTVFNFHNKNQNSPLFFRELFKSTHFINSLVKITYGIRDGRSISFKEFGRMFVYVPCTEEQTKIGDFLSKLDELIDVNNEKLEQYKLLKKGYMQRIFYEEAE